MSTIPPLKPGSLEGVHDFLNQKNSALDVFFAPTTVAVIGATETEGSVGRTILRNLISSPFGGTIYPVNPKRPNVLGIKAYPKISAVPERVDLAVIVTPAPTVPGVIQECVAAGVRGSIIISAGFKETGPAGAELERKVMEEAKRHPSNAFLEDGHRPLTHRIDGGRMRIIGPNCLGAMNPLNGFNATFAATMALPGSVGFVSQSGALLTAILDWSLQERVGFSAFISIGSMLDVGWGDLIDYLGDDPRTKSIVIYMETIGDARSFLSAAREVALTKPIIVIKAGRTAGAAKAAASHTGSLAGSDDVLDAAFRRAGVLRVNRISDLFHMAEILGKQPRPKGGRLTIVTNAGGPGVLATDALLQTGGALASVSKETLNQLNTFLPPAWSHNNPIDVLGDASPDRYAKAIETAAKDPESDGMLVILTPQAMTDATKTAEALTPFAKIEGKPVLASWMGGAAVEPGIEVLRKADIPVFSYPDTAARAFTYMWKYARNLEGLYETPSPAAIADEGNHAVERAQTLLQRVQASNRILLTEVESKQLLASYGIQTVPTHHAETEKEAVKVAESLGYPVVLKLYSETITHKTDVGGVQLNVRNAQAVANAFRTIQRSVTEKVNADAFEGVTVQPMVQMKDAYEIILGSSIDPQFGPVLLFGAGGQLVEVFKDRSLGLPPLNTTLARRLMEHTQIYTALKGVRGRKPVDLKALEQLLVRFSKLVVDHRRIKEVDINPLLVSPEGLLALDARVLLHEARVKDSSLPKLAIRPYPQQYVSPWKLKNGTKVQIRPIRHQDEPMMVRFHESLSEQSVYLRYFQALKLSQRITHERLLRRCFIDYDREMALVADAKNPKTGEHELLGVARLIKLHGTPSAEFALLVSDKVQHQGLGLELMKRLIQIARDEGIKTLEADVLRENTSMQNLLKHLEFTLSGEPQDAAVHVEYTIR